MHTQILSGADFYSAMYACVCMCVCVCVCVVCVCVCVCVCSLDARWGEAVKNAGAIRYLLPLLGSKIHPAR